jgi:rSAM/selenodomain-associated transferase 1
MLKVPVAGRVKTRLARGIGVVAATAFYRHAPAALLARIDRPRRWTTVLAVTPDPECRSPALPRHLPRIAQGRGNLGARLQRIMDLLPTGPVVVIGSDVPHVNAGHLAEAFQKLAGSDAVLGPSSDGGYWLVGLRRCPRRLRAFDRVRWSSAQALADTEGNLAGADVRLIATLDDIDEASDLASQGGWTGRRIPPRGLRQA